ncbi:winged helix DNA-binding domain-containing protein [Promicromonospora thailandica]|uniref:Winged helix DNA-binding domain-containing protein n=1 Tax=Promicromonospora thailandica TaxID=765201 RepID=A0A9X2FXC2_9MICO|nr:winged helix DNA-binding domain-containing protein [Promicromonospora thailandica]MCP2262859.1 Winged helix DNA-binding domain-containing protein [Promicromonospora thailandica]
MSVAPVPLAPDVARRLRLHAQGVAPADPSRADDGPVDVVRRMVALQGQDLPAVLRAIALRSRPGTTVDDVRAAFDAGDLVRGWTQRGTLFATTPRDLAALVSLTGERMLHTGRRVRDAEGLDDAVVDRAEAVAREALADPGPDGGVTRTAMTERWRDAGVPVEGQRSYHLIVTLALRGLLHWGPFAGAQQVMVPTPRPAAPEQPDAALRRIARSYLVARGPASADDLAWWLGLPKVPVRAAVAAAREEHPEALADVVVDGRPMLAAPVRHSPGPVGVVLVPGFDETVLGYQDRTLVADEETMRLVVPYSNGIFRPAVLLDGRLVGTWRRAPKKGEPAYELVPSAAAGTRAAVEDAVAAWRHG